MKAQIAAIEYALPSRCITNEDLDRLHPDWSMEEVAKVTGVYTRYFCDDDQTGLDLSADACERLFEKGIVGRDEIGAIIVCTQTPDHPIPPNSTLLQARLQLSRSVVAFDFSLACSGFIYGLFIAKSLLESDALDNILLITAETYSKKVAYPKDRGAISVIGDGAAVTLLRKASKGLGEFVMGTDGSRGPIVPAGGARMPISSATSIEINDTFGNVYTQENIHMDGPGILTFVRKEIPKCVRNLLEKTGYSNDDISLFVFHQASGLALDYLDMALKIPESKRYRNISRVGNTVSSSIPMAIRDAESEGRILAGDRLLLAGFGAGYSWGSCIVDW